MGRYFETIGVIACVIGGPVMLLSILAYVVDVTIPRMKSWPELKRAHLRMLRDREATTPPKDTP